MHGPSFAQERVEKDQQLHFVVQYMDQAGAAFAEIVPDFALARIDDVYSILLLALVEYESPGRSAGAGALEGSGMGTSAEGNSCCVRHVQRRVSCSSIVGEEIARERVTGSAVVVAVNAAIAVAGVED
jgi:hypothetical protein